MTPRIVLCTGKGGVGKTSVAAATARASARAGHRTLVLSTDPAHSLADVLGVALGSAPSGVQERLDAQQVSARDELERHWSQVRAWLGGLLVEGGVDRISAEELTVPPGLDELINLLALRRHVDEGRYDVLVVDCAPTGETLRLLSFPDVARWWLDRVFPEQSRIMGAARPFARAVLDLQLPGDEVFDEVRRLTERLVALSDLLRDRSRVSVRLVMNPDRMVIDEARRTFTYLNLYGLLTDAVVVNRVFPSEVDGYFGAWRDRQQEHLADVRDAFAPVPVLTAPFLPAEIVGGAGLDELGAALYGGEDPARVLHAELTQHLAVREDGATLRLALPFASRGEVTLKRVGDELLVGVGAHRRTFLLPATMADHEPTGARLVDGELVVDFRA